MTWELRQGDCRQVLATLEEASVDAVVTDPPYELGFMGKAWDASGIAYNIELWREVLRVLKPGGHLLAFGGTRTYHRMACAIEDAGFEIRDSIHWLYGTGFPKSLDVSKAIDKAAGAEREVVGKSKNFGATKIADGKTGFGDYAGEWNLTVPSTDDAKRWQGWGTALKPAHESVVMARKPLVGTVAANVLAYGTGAINVDGCRISLNGEKPPTGSGNNLGYHGGGRGTGGNESTTGRFPANLVLSHADDCDDACAPGCPVAELDAQSDGASRFFGVFKCGDESTTDASTSVGRKTESSAASLLTGGRGSKRTDQSPTGSKSITETRIRSTTTSSTSNASTPNGTTTITSGSEKTTESRMASNTAGANAAENIYCSLNSKGVEPVLSRGTAELVNVTTSPNGETETPITSAAIDRSIASADTFFYVAKPSRRERDLGCEHLPPRTAGEATDREEGTDGLNSPRAGAGRTGGARNHHPTVKPIALMRWLCRLITPPGGLILDPFAGSGTTGIAALQEGFRFIGIDLEPEYARIAITRIEEDMPLFNRRRGA